MTKTPRTGRPRRHVAALASWLSDHLDKPCDLACWVFTGKRWRDGYGRVNAIASELGGRFVQAHRLAWVLRNRVAIPAGMCVCHVCDNPPCCNPEHLFLATSAQNTADKIAKGRQARGEATANMTGKLTVESVREIRTLAASVAQNKIAPLFGVTPTMVSRVVSGKAWVHA